MKTTIAYKRKGVVMDNPDVIKTFALSVAAKDIYQTINLLTQDNIKADTIPYLQDAPIPENMNIINGRKLGDINKITLETYAAKIGAKSTMFLFGADAEYLGLELKSSNQKEMNEARKENKNFSCDPIIVFANVQRNMAKNTYDIANETDIAHEGAQLDAQCVYLLDQFTEKSKQRVYTHLESRINKYDDPALQKKAKIMTQNIIKYRNEYNSGTIEKEQKELIKTNCKHNMAKLTKDGKENPIRKEVELAMKEITSGKSPEEKAIFSTLYKYYMQQQSGINCGLPLSETEKEQFKLAINKLSKENSPLLAETMSKTMFFVKRLGHYNFSYEYVYSEKDLQEKQRVATARKAMLHQDKPLETARLIDDENARKALLTPDRQQKVRTNYQTNIPTNASTEPFQTHSQEHTMETRHRNSRPPREPTRGIM